MPPDWYLVTGRRYSAAQCVSPCQADVERSTGLAGEILRAEALGLRISSSFCPMLTRLTLAFGPGRLAIRHVLGE
jgi:hypothetical protein